ncbi:hypothetical protein Tco_0324468 [Tanacetum coccineum]
MTPSVGRKSNAIFVLPGHGSTSSVGRKSNAIVVQNAVQNQGNQNVGNQNGLSVISRIANQHGNGNVIAAQAEGNGAYEEIERVNANCTLKDNMQQASTSGTQTDKAPVYHSEDQLSVEQSGETVQKHTANVEETRALYDSLYNNLATEVEKIVLLEKHIPPAVYDSKETRANCSESVKNDDNLKKK